MVSDRNLAKQEKFSITYKRHLYPNIEKRSYSVKQAPWIDFLSTEMNWILSRKTYVNLSSIMNTIESSFFFLLESL